MLVTVAASIGGAAGWWLGARVSLFSAFLVSIIGTAAGVYYSRKAINEHLP